VRNNFTSKIPVSTGIRQENNPILFIIDEITKKEKDVGREYRMRDKEIKIVRYTDDAVIISKDEDNL
jgi:hypothetical protein